MKCEVDLEQEDIEIKHEEQAVPYLLSPKEEPNVSSVLVDNIFAMIGKKCTMQYTYIFYVWRDSALSMTDGKQRV